MINTLATFGALSLCFAEPTGTPLEQPGFSYQNPVSTSQVLDKEAPNLLKNTWDHTIEINVNRIKQHLNENYSHYTWIDESRRSIEEFSGGIPVEMGSDDFTTEEIREGIYRAHKENLTSYGGCGPIATMCVLDYFARYLGFSHISPNPSAHEEKVKLATEVMEASPILPLDKMPLWYGDEATAELPQGIRQCFNQVIRQHGLWHIIEAKDYWTIDKWRKEEFFAIIKEYIDKGIPVTFANAILGNGAFKQHTVNIYAYHNWVGISPDGMIYKKQFLEARLGWGRSERYCFDADLLNQGLYGIVVYDINYPKEHLFGAKDLKRYFVNENGGGQYFFEPKEAIVDIPPSTIFDSKRPRTSCIEDQYLVLSPNRKGAGTAYLELTFAHAIQKLEFTAALWSEREHHYSEEFRIQYWLSEDDECGINQAPGSWIDHKNISLEDIPKDKDNQKEYMLYFPNHVRRFRFIATHQQPSGDRNQGRICLDSFRLSYY